MRMVVGAMRLLWFSFRATFLFGAGKRTRPEVRCDMILREFHLFSS